jgi:hypothetical protein
MGFIKGSIKLVGNVVTLGGMSRLENAQKTYQESYELHKNTYEDAKSVELKIHTNINSIGIFLKKAKKTLDKGEAILTGSLRSNNKVIENIAATQSTLTQIAKFQEEYSSVSSIGAGVVTGSTMAIGSWTLVSTFGAASTGAAIAQLSGVAASNATLAWFGGGSLAAGGAGMSGGALVLGGLVAIPLVVIAAKGTHSKAKEVEDETIKVDEATKKLKEQIDAMIEMMPFVLSKKEEADVVCSAFIEKMTSLRNIIRPWGIFSLLKQKFIAGLARHPSRHISKMLLFHFNQRCHRF